jgi:hypothetical protein
VLGTILNGWNPKNSVGGYYGHYSGYYHGQYDRNGHAGSNSKSAARQVPA